VKAGDGNRTHVACLEGRYSTIELHPRFRRRPSRRPKELIAGHKGRLSFMSQVSSAMVRISSGLRPPSQSFILSQFCGNYHRSEPGRVIEPHPIPVGINMGGAGFEPAKALPPDLQSGPFGRLGIHPFQSDPDVIAAGRSPSASPTTVRAELAERLELSTLGLQNRCSAD
jgi:hypothetical protein